VQLDLSVEPRQAVLMRVLYSLQEEKEAVDVDVDVVVDEGFGVVKLGKTAIFQCRVARGPWL